MENDEFQLKPQVGSARKIARDLLRIIKITEAPVYLPKIINYLKSQHDLEVLRFPLGAVSGLLVMIDGYPTIGFNVDDVWVRKRFTIAHEIGHLLMGHTCDRLAENRNTEIEADQFAAELLVPLKLIKKDYAKQPDLKLLADKYIVSKEVLCIRLMESRVL